MQKCTEEVHHMCTTVTAPQSPHRTLFFGLQWYLRSNKPSQKALDMHVTIAWYSYMESGEWPIGFYVTCRGYARLMGGAHHADRAHLLLSPRLSLQNRSVFVHNGLK